MGGHWRKKAAEAIAVRPRFRPEAAIRFASEGSAATAAKAAAGEASTAAEPSPAPSRGAGTGPWRGHKGRGRLIGHGPDAVDEVNGVEHAWAGALIPGGRILHDAFKILGPAVLHAQGHGERQKLLECI